MLILLEPIDLRFGNTQSAFENAVVDHTVQCDHCSEDFDCMRNFKDSLSVI